MAGFVIKLERVEAGPLSPAPETSPVVVGFARTDQRDSSPRPAQRPVDSSAPKFYDSSDNTVEGTAAGALGLRRVLGRRNPRAAATGIEVYSLIRGEIAPKPESRGGHRRLSTFGPVSPAVARGIFKPFSSARMSTAVPASHRDVRKITLPPPDGLPHCAVQPR